MKILHCLVAFALTCGLSGVAKASAVSFQMVVIDPSYAVNTVTNNSFTFGFSPCVAPGQVPVGTSFIGCFTGQNETGHILTSLQLIVPLIPGQSAGCAPSGTGLDLFSQVTCGSTPSGYILNFAGGGIVEDQLFTIAEAGIDPANFPDVSAAFNVTPEPSSIWLFATGILAGAGLLLADPRRRAALLSRV